MIAYVYSVPSLGRFFRVPALAFGGRGSPSAAPKNCLRPGAALSPCAASRSGTHFRSGLRSGLRSPPFILVPSPDGSHGGDPWPPDFSRLLPLLAYCSLTTLRSAPLLCATLLAPASPAFEAALPAIARQFPARCPPVSPKKFLDTPAHCKLRSHRPTEISPESP